MNSGSFYVTLGQKLRARRRSKHLTLSDLAEKLNKSAERLGQCILQFAQTYAQTIFSAAPYHFHFVPPPLESTPSFKALSADCHRLASFSFFCFTITLMHFPLFGRRAKQNTLSSDV